MSRSSRVLHSLLLERVVVTCKSGTSFSGLYFTGDSTALVLRNATALGVNSDGSNASADGEIIILLADVAFIQRP